MATQYIFLNIFALLAYVLASPANDLQLATTPITRELKSVFIYDCEEEQITSDNEIIVVEGCGETEVADVTFLPESAEGEKASSKDNSPAPKVETETKEENNPGNEPKEKENKQDDGCKKGNPGNHKCVGNAGENPDGKGNWGAGDKGKGNADKDNGKDNGAEKGKGKGKNK
jgi:hypothetical protein